MEESEKAPLVKRTEFRPIDVSAEEAVPVVQCCCVESTRLGRVPIVRTLFKKNSEKVSAACKLACTMHVAMSMQWS